jgi:pyruvate/2-oxoglutarate dehydrogenase complex dihydrolipoamide dehydrogenase (E3) component
MGSGQRTFDFDLAVIGGGSGGYAAARTAAAEGLRTVVLEGGKDVGGLCILRGCMPTKALLYAAEVMHLASHPDPWGIRAEEVRFNFAQVMARKDTLINIENNSWPAASSASSGPWLGLLMGTRLS